MQRRHCNNAKEDAQDKQTPGAVADAEQQKDEVADIQQVEQSEKEKLNRAKEALNTIKSKDVDARKKDEQLEQKTKSVLDTSNEGDKPSAEYISVMQRYPKRLRSKVRISLGGYSGYLRRRSQVAGAQCGGGDSWCGCDTSKYP